MTHINGPVIAVNATTGQLEWTRLFGNRSLLDDEASGLPFVVMCANFQQRGRPWNIAVARSGRSANWRDPGVAECDCPWGV
ncbi:MAG: hypothetical protein R3C12_02435 [Planctomycetaceae bacterium]